MSTPTPETLRALVERLRETFDPGGSLDPDGPDEWVLDHLLALDELAALLDTATPALTREQAEARLTDQALRDACSTPPDTSDDEITDMRRRLLDALFGEGT